MQFKVKHPPLHRTFCLTFLHARPPPRRLGLPPLPSPAVIIPPAAGREHRDGHAVSRRHAGTRTSKPTIVLMSEALVNGQIELLHDIQDVMGLFMDRQKHAGSPRTDQGGTLQHLGSEDLGRASGRREAVGKHACEVDLGEADQWRPCNSKSSACRASLSTVVCHAAMWRP